MHEVPPAVKELAYQLLFREGNPDLDAVELAADTQQLCIRLEGRLTKVFGRSGYLTLLGRAVHLAKREYKDLERIDVDGELPGGLQGLREYGAGSSDDPRAAGAALSYILANLIWLLVIFIGAELSIRLIAELWPELAESAGVLSQQEGKPHS